MDMCWHSPVVAKAMAWAIVHGNMLYVANHPYSQIQKPCDVDMKDAIILSDILSQHTCDEPIHSLYCDVIFSVYVMCDMGCVYTHVCSIAHRVRVALSTAYTCAHRTPCAPSVQYR